MDSAIDIAARASHREALRYLRAAPGLLLAGALRGLAAGGLTPRRRTTRRRGECAERRRRELEECRRARAIYGLGTTSGVGANSAQRLGPATPLGNVHGAGATTTKKSDRWIGVRYESAVSPGAYAECPKIAVVTFFCPEARSGSVKFHGAPERAQAPRDEAPPGVLVFRPAAAPRHPYALEMSR